MISILEDDMVVIGLMVILVLVLILPFALRQVEENLEVFLFVMGFLACWLSGHLSWGLVLEALHEPIMIAAAVFIAGLLFLKLQNHLAYFIRSVLTIVPLWFFAFFMIAILGLLSSAITAIIASLVLVEVISLLPLERRHKIVICVISCFSIGFGAAMTPIGEPLATIAISKLDQDFFYLLRLLGKYIVPGVITFGILGALYITWAQRQTESVPVKKINSSNEGEVIDPIGSIEENEGIFGLISEEEYENVKSPAAGDEEPELARDTWAGILVRALKIYLFVMALVFLGQGFQIIVETYILTLDYRLLYWVNMVSAVLDNATLTAAEISPNMSTMQIEAILMGLLASGGMLIPGNIPNIISASKLKISSSEWAKVGVPGGLVVMVLYFLILF